MNRLNNKRVLITCGPTWVPIDGMRVISNQSSGHMGQLFAQAFLNKGSRVDVLLGPVEQTIKPDKKLSIISFKFYDELKRLLKKQLKQGYDYVVHAAAVSDYELVKTSSTKIKSNLSSLTLDLKPTKKLIPLIKQWNPNVTLIGFKLETNITKLNVSEMTHHLFAESQCDWVVANSQTAKSYKAYILNSNQELSKQLTQKKDVVDLLINKLDIKG